MASLGHGELTAISVRGGDIMWNFKALQKFGRQLSCYSGAIYFPNEALNWSRHIS